MHEWQSQSHVRWECKYHVVIAVHGLHFWAVGYCVSTVGLDEQTIREYIRQQEKLETGQNKFDFE